MSIFKVLEDKITKQVEDYTAYLGGITGDTLKGAEFMFYSLANIFNDKTIDEIEMGMVDSSYRKEKYDYGIDAIYITGSREFIEQVDQLENYNEDTKFCIHLFQFKRGAGISQADLLKFNNGIEKIVVNEDLIDTDNLHFYNRMQDLDDVKRELYQTIDSSNIEIICHIVFGGVEANITNDKLLQEELDKIKVTLSSNGYTNNKIIITDCQALINSKANEAEITDIIGYEKSLKYITEISESEKFNGFICILKGKEIAELVRKHQSSIFEANIRDYYKRSDLNNKITKTSSSEDEAKYFWSFNNGLTMTCRRVQELPKDQYKLHNMQIVNGCQTSNSIYTAVKNKERVDELNLKVSGGMVLTKKEQEELDEKLGYQFNEDTSILVKIIETKKDDLIYRITETTNSQTPIKAFSLKANDDIQFLIEEYLSSRDICYERRLNFYKNKGKKNIINIQKLFQLFTAQIFFKPSQVKTSPKSMFVNTYDDVFPSPSVTNMNYILYLIPIKIDLYLSKKIREVQRSGGLGDGYKDTILSYGKFHLGCLILSSILKENYNKAGIVKNETIILTELEENFDTHFSDSIINLEKILKNLIGNRKESIIPGVRKTELDQKLAKFINNRK
ncbi:MAG: AIPR family protein [Candidatus Gracilibacteria bacterium]